jgi:vacuolar-type H+-ATPase catalytic subunit A/Vma1
MSSELLSFKKSITSNNREAIEKYLSQIKNIPDDFLNQALFWSIDNYKVEEQTDECLHILLKYNSNSELIKNKANPNC